MFKQKCDRCGGAGKLTCFEHVDGGKCYKCAGAGFVLVKTNPKKLEKAKNKLFRVGFKWADDDHCNYNNGDFLMVWGAQHYPSKPACVRKVAEAMQKNGSVNFVIVEERKDEESGCWYSLVEKIYG